ncbi:MAG TPA: hypothetical protein VFT12_10845 [Thermoanaerobaculia bacterium]|nr:hypothetical protein [Thermoanaerobaculia bacterium]
MRLTKEEIALLAAACGDRNNAKAQELVNVVGTAGATEIVAHIALLPLELQRDLERHVREALDEQRRRVRR